MVLGVKSADAMKLKFIPYLFLLAFGLSQPDPPANVQYCILNDPYLEPSLELSWDSSPNADHYNIYYQNSVCPEGTVEDCSGDGDCCPEYWIGDDLPDCEDQQWGCDLTCYDNDGGDCDDEDDDICPVTVGGNNCTDCIGQNCDGYESWIGDGYCDDGTWGMYFNCEEFDCDGGDCDLALCDGDDSSSTDGTSGCLYDYSEHGSDNCDSAWQDFGITCAELEEDYGWDCSGCECIGPDEYLCTDCIGLDCTNYQNWIGDGICDDGTWGLYFNCDEFDCDGGDCLDENGDCIGSDGGGDINDNIKQRMPLRYNSNRQIQFLQTDTRDWQFLTSTQDTHYSATSLEGEDLILGVSAVNDDGESGIIEAAFQGGCDEACNSGDVNSDGEVNVTDIVATVQYIVDGYTEQNIHCADINADGQINVADIMFMVNIILEQ